MGPTGSHLLSPDPITNGTEPTRHQRRRRDGEIPFPSHFSSPHLKKEEPKNGTTTTKKTTKKPQPTKNTHKKKTTQTSLFFQACWNPLG